MKLLKIGLASALLVALGGCVYGPAGHVRHDGYYGSRYDYAPSYYEYEYGPHYYGYGYAYPAIGIGLQFRDHGRGYRHSHRDKHRRR